MSCQSWIGIQLVRQMAIVMEPRREGMVIRRVGQQSGPLSGTVDGNATEAPVLTTVVLGRKVMV